MEDRIDSVLSAERKADALVVEARDEAERKLNKTRTEIEAQRRTLEAKLADERLRAVREARVAAEKELEALRIAEQREAAELRTVAVGRVDAGRELILKALLEGPDQGAKA